ncbi:MAG: hypothetical protein K0S67_790 [Nitrososphaeraceae archaeon]|nr:hypothetical protein [Nitrososphaeraceae archaeon]
MLIGILFSCNLVVTEKRLSLEDQTTPQWYNIKEILIKLINYSTKDLFNGNTIIT